LYQAIVRERGAACPKRSVSHVLPKKIGVQSYLFNLSSASPFFSAHQEFPRPPGFIIAGGTMTDIGRQAHVAPAQTQLSVHSYFDEAIFAQEQALIFKHSALYVGNEKLVPEIGD